MIDIFEELRAICRALDNAGIKHALVGGLAYSIWVKPRNTVDIDLLIPSGDWERIPALLGSLGYESLAGPMDFPPVRMRRLTKVQGEEALVVDFILAEGEMAQGLDRAVPLEHEGQTFAVAPPDVIITLKRARMSPQDKIDIAGLERLLEEEGK